MKIREDIDTVLFDLDGTLIPMDMEEFTSTYFGELAKKMESCGHDREKTIKSIWAATKEMIVNDGSCSNMDRFWQSFEQQLGPKVQELKGPLDEFYRVEFDEVGRVTKPNPYARKLVDALKQRGYTLILATNPLFPMDANIKRMNWVGLTTEDFLMVTSYENSSYCKPSLGYYEEILEKSGKKPESCVMIGNSVTEDLVAKQCGIDCFLVTDCIENAHVDYSGFPQGSFKELFNFFGIEEQV